MRAREIGGLWPLTHQRFIGLYSLASFQPGKVGEGDDKREKESLNDDDDDDDIFFESLFFFPRAHVG